MTNHESPLYPLLNEINIAAANGMPLLAVSMTVALPDICVSLTADDGRTSSEKYKSWCQKYLGDKFAYLSPEDLWSMRCGVLHNGRFGDLKHTVNRVIFTLPGAGAFVNCKFQDAYFYSVTDFCRNFTEAAYAWCEAHRDDDNLKSNMPRLMQYRFGGFPPYVGGLTVLA